MTAGVSTYYCHRCARSAGHVAPVTPPAAAGGQYQLEKYIKHTQPTGVYPVNSVFADSNWSAYQNHLVAGAASGCLEIDPQGRKNLIFFAGEQTGLRFDNGHFTAPCSGVKVVCSEDASKVHGFPSDFQPESRTCASCGQPAPFDPRTCVDLDLL